MRRSPAAGVSALVVLSAAACIPPVIHSPRVERGTTYVISGSFMHTPGVQDEPVVLAPGIFAGASRGWVLANGTAFSLGAQVPVLALPFALLSLDEPEAALSLIMLDAYVQPSRAAEGGIDYGAGAMLSTGMVVPYVQLGRSGDGGIYTTQAVSYTYRSLNPLIYWMPSVSYRSERPDGSRAVNYFASGLVGWPRDTPSGGDRDREWAVNIGVLLEISRRR